MCFNCRNWLWQNGERFHDTLLISYNGLRSVFMAALCNRGAIIFLPCDFYLSSSSFFFLFFSSPNLSGRRLDVCHTSTHGVALVRI